MIRKSWTKLWLKKNHYLFDKSRNKVDEVTGQMEEGWAMSKFMGKIKGDK